MEIHGAVFSLYMFVYKEEIVKNQIYKIAKNLIFEIVENKVKETSFKLVSFIEIMYLYISI